MARTLRYATSSLSLFREIFYTVAQLGEESITVGYVPTFEALRDDLKAVLVQELSMLEMIAKAQAAVDRTDARLDRFVLRVLRAVDEHTAGATRRQLRKKLLKGRTTSKFRRPVLGRQLQDMSDWSSILSSCGIGALAGLSAEASAHYAIGSDAAKLRDKAQADDTGFRHVGARKQFVDGLNGARVDLEGKLAKLPFQDATLPQDFSDGFFLHDPPREEEEETIGDVEETIQDLKAQLADAEARLAVKQQEAAAAAQQEEQDEAAEAQAEALEKQAAALLAQAAMLKKK